MEAIRSFIAIEISSENKAKIVEIQNELSSRGGNIKLVEPQNIHITLHFLGNQNIDTLNRIITLLEPVFTTIPVFEFQPRGIGAFPTVNNPRVIWVGIGEGKEIIQDIHTRSRIVLEEIGIQMENKKFHPHLTLARVKSGKNKHLITRMLKSYTPPVFNSQKTGEIILFKSTLTPQGPIYQKLHTWKLGE